MEEETGLYSDFHNSQNRIVKPCFKNQKEKINLESVLELERPRAHLPAVLTEEPHSAHGQLCWGLDVHECPLQSPAGPLLSGNQSRRRGLA